MTVNQTRYCELRPFDGVRLAAAVEAAARAIGVTTTAGYWGFSAKRRLPDDVVENKTLRSLDEVRALSGFDGQEQAFAFTREMTPWLHVGLLFRDVLVCGLSCDAVEHLNPIFGAVVRALGTAEIVSEACPSAQVQQEPEASRLSDRLSTAIEALIPAAGRSYRQAIADLAGGVRISYRGTAAELREAYREVLDTLAADDKVQAEADFKQEAGVRGPTQRQKVRYVLRQRARDDKAIDSASHVADVIEAMSGFGRAVYTHANMLHKDLDLQECRKLRRHIDTILMELLDVHVE